MKNKAQVTLEACLLFVILVAAGLAMHGYLKQAIQGNWRTNVDSFSDEQYNDASIESDSGIEIISPTIKVDLDKDKSVDATYHLSSGSGITHIDEWGTYNE